MPRVAIVPHTHWDREWYEPFQSFRYRLVEVLDGLLELLETDPSYERFLLDGQLAVVDDYLEVRPEAEDRLRALASAGRLSVGPWYILPDEFLVSGETIVRNLQMGFRRGAAFGGVMPVGYLPDMFGHIAQMPQLLRLAGLSHAVVWRGVPSQIRRSGFWWEAPDGSRVRAEYLPAGYSNGAGLPSDPKSLLRRIEDAEQELSDYLAGPMLLMNGADHLSPQNELGKVVREANMLQEDYQLEITSIPEYLARAPVDGLATWRGELRSGARANILMGVASSRVDVKQAAARAERAVERRAEPYAALFLGAHGWPSRLLELAWLQMVRNSAHDSICACSVDEVTDAVLHRYAQARQIGEAIAHDALGALARSMAEPGPLVVNPSARARSGVVEVAVVADSPPPHTQPLSSRVALPGTMTLDASTLRTVLGMLQGPKIDNDTYIQGVSISEDQEGIDVLVSLGTDERPVPLLEAKQDLYTRLGARPNAAVRVRLDQPPIQRVAARVAEVPGFGWQRFVPAPISHPASVEVVAGGTPELPPGAAVLANDLMTVVVDPTEATFSVNGCGGLGRVVDDGDHGDSYNYSPPAVDTIVDRPESASVSVEQPGPIQAVAVLRARFRWPDHVEGSSSKRVGEHEAEVTTRLELRADEAVLRVSHAFINPSRDHRVRVLFPLPEPASASEADCAFATVRRGLLAEGSSSEHGLPTFPSHRFVQAGGLTICHDGLHEYELTEVSDGPSGPVAHALALTVLRATGMLSRVGMRYRPLPAGPLTPVEALQMVGRTITVHYAVALDCADPWALADDVLVPLETVQSLGGGWRPSAGSALAVTGGVVTAVHRQAGALEVRVCNPCPQASEVRFDSRSGWIVDFRGRPVEPFDGSFILGPWGIATARLDEA